MFNLIKLLAGLVAISFLFGNQVEAMPLDQPLNLALQQRSVPQYHDPAVLQGSASNVDSDEDDDYDVATSQSDNRLYQLSLQPIMAGQSLQQFQALPVADLKASASHHHGHHAKGWLDMGAWTGKKGSFGWYDKHPVGKGK